MLPIAATQPPGEATRLDSFRGALAGELLLRLTLADSDSSLAEALDRWELSLFQQEPFRSEQLRATFAAALGATWPLRAAVLLEPNPTERSLMHGDLTNLATGNDCSHVVADAARCVLVATLQHGDRVGLLRELDEALLGVSDRHGLRLAV